MLPILLLALAPSLLAPAQEEERREPRVVVLALAGLGAERVEAGIASGGLPHLAALARVGSLLRMRGLPGGEAPATWTALFTGVSPAEGGVTGFVRRGLHEGRPFPTFGHLDFETFDVDAAGEGLSAELGELLRGRVPHVVTTNEAPFVWEHAAAAGVPSIALRAPMAFDRPAVEGARVLFGLGLPDARGAIGDWFLYTTEPIAGAEEPHGSATATAGTLYAVRAEDGRVLAELYGPRDVVREAVLAREAEEIGTASEDPALTYKVSLGLVERLTKVEDELAALRPGVRIELEIVPLEDAADVRIGAETQRVALGAWSEPFRPAFPLARGFEIRALTRVKLLALEPHLRLYVHRLDLDPSGAPPWRHVSAPPSFAAELAAAHGPFETYGWRTATMPYKDGLVDAATVAESAFRALEQDRTLLAGVLARDDWRLLCASVSSAAELEHALARADREAVDAAYAALDALVGDARAALREGDVLLVASPSALAPFRRRVHLQNWLASKGYLAADLSLSTGLDAVDWPATRAYALGLGHVYLNLAGREAHGVVRPSEAEALLDEIEEALLALRDPDGGARVVSAVFRPRRLFQGEHADDLPDLVVGFAPPYRIGWADVLGGLAVEGAGGERRLTPFVSDNGSPWAADHASVDPAAVEGVLLASVPLTAAVPGALDVRALAPTVLALLGVEPPDALDLPPLGR